MFPFLSLGHRTKNICECLHTTAKVRKGRSWSFVGGPIGMEVVVLGGHGIVGPSKTGKAPPGLDTWSRIEMVVGGDVHVCI